MGRACGTYGGEERCTHGFGGETRWKETNWKTWEDNTKKDFQEMGWGMDWLDLTQDGEKRRALVNAEMNVRVE